jgi:hypothetical protein
MAFSIAEQMKTNRNNGGGGKQSKSSDA